MAWLFLALAIVFEVTGTIALKLSDGLAKLPFVGITVVAYLASFALLALSLKFISVGAAYAIWAGVGTALIALIGMIWFGEPATLARVGCLALIIAGVIGLRMLEAGTA